MSEVSKSRFSRIDVIRSQVDKMLKEVYTSIPAIVQSYDSETQTARVTLAISQRLNAEEFIDAPTIPDVPVIFPFGGDFRMGWTLKKNDHVLLMFSMRSLEEYYGSKGNAPVVPFSKRIHSKSDAIALAGMLPSGITRDEAYKDNPHLADEETYVVFNEDETNGLTIKTDKNVKVKAAHVEIESPTVNITGALTVGQTIDAGGIIHSDVDVTGADTSLEEHTHPAGNLKDAQERPIKYETAKPSP